MKKILGTFVAIEIITIIVAIIARGYFAIGGELVIPLIALVAMITKGEEHGR